VKQVWQWDHQTGSMRELEMKLINARVLGHSELQQVWLDQSGGWLGQQPMTDNPATSRSLELLGSGPIVTDLAGDWVSPGGVDLQINGALGLAFPDLLPGDEVKLLEIAQFLWQQGIDGFLPTLVTTAVDKIQHALSVIQSAMQQQANDLQPAAQILGAHLEGPFLNPAKRGAHPAEFLLPLTLENIRQVLGGYGAIVRVITLAPELDPTGTVIPDLVAQGITVSLGHSLATADQAQQAFDQGATLVTHAFNAMPGLHHREPGLLGAAIAQPTVYTGLIADGQHVCPMMIGLLLRASLGTTAAGGVFLVSDALSPLGLPDGTYPWDSREMTITQGTARLTDGTLAGTTLPLLAGATNLARWQLCSPERAITLATTAPRQAIGLPPWPSKGSSWLRWHWDLESRSLTWQRLVLC